MSVFQLHRAGTLALAVQRNSSIRTQALSPGTGAEEVGQRLGGHVVVDEHHRAPRVDA